MTDDDEQESVTLCDPCSKKLTEENWLGVLQMPNCFTCAICHSTCCQHLRVDGEQGICMACANHDV